MVVRDFNLCRAFRGPFEAHPELVINPDRVLSGSSNFQRLKPVAGWRFQILQSRCGVRVSELPAGHFNDVCRKPLRTFPIKNRFGDRAPKAPDHSPYVSFHDTNVKFLYHDMIHTTCRADGKCLTERPAFLAKSTSRLTNFRLS